MTVFTYVDVNLKCFCVKAGRVPRNVRRGNPGPNAYNLQTSLLHQHDFNRGESRTFRLPIAVKRETPKIQNPAPNQYHVSYSVVDRDSTVSARCAFLSKTKRSRSFLDNCKGPSPYPPLPGPGHYDIIKYSGPVKQPVSSAAFLSGTHRGTQESTEQQIPGPALCVDLQQLDTTEVILGGLRNNCDAALDPHPRGSLL
ncbi:O(6)-methylguanine-induced apoptosis 2 [Triplophysa tibetana]|uniref:O(6)-methylguanine-induced apoptosis 2 n=1 Tax=Triplophysa tibetana TaxID=1572043 RepID=A0A5A9NMA0_9TELE|nr:O(6)-methylguanine-induced apoptosis 2 [Triplophysa tibetana]